MGRLDRASGSGPDDRTGHGRRTNEGTGESARARANRLGCFLGAFVLVVMATLFAIKLWLMST